MKFLLDTSVWISYFGERPENCQNRCRLAQSIINWLNDNGHEIFYSFYTLKELQPINEKRNRDINKMKHIATQLPDHIGNDTWDNVDIPWDCIGSNWGNRH